MSNDIAYDLELYPNCFTLCAEHCHLPIKWDFQISSYRDDSAALKEWLIMLKTIGARMIGFHSIGFDYPVLHTFIQMGFKASPQTLYEKAMQIIQSEDRFAHLVYPSDRFIEQIDLFKIHHFDNKARSTSLKALEFNMRMDNISDLPFPVGTILNEQQITQLLQYNAHDVTATKMFYFKTLEQIAFREQLTKKHGKDFMNHSDVSIGKQIFQMELEKVGIPLYEYSPAGRTPRQSKRSSIALRDCILPWIELETPGFKRVLDWLRQQVVSETKGVFEDLKVREFGLEFVFGTGGIHASVENESVIADENTIIESRDVSSYYPNLAIQNHFYPEHLGEKFCEIYKQLYEQRKNYPKGSAENAMLKLALNGTYGASNDKFSVFYDPAFTLKITLNGQLLLCLLAERLARVKTVQLKMLNTDGLEYTIHPDYVEEADSVCTEWSNLTKLQLESARYSKLIIANCNNYIGVFV